MEREDLKKRTKQFALRIIRLANTLQKKGESARTLAKQILRSGTSIGANYRAACIAKSDNDYINKLKICEEEADETSYWLELLGESKLIAEELLTNLHDESRQLTAIITASIKTKRRNMAN